jgi:hypothetical protein
MPASNPIVQALLPAVIGGLIGGAAVSYFHRDDAPVAAESRATSGAATGIATADLDALRSDVARLKANAPSQSHTMSDVGAHWANLWFAGEKKNWPLAMFYFGEARNHIRWTIQLRPVRKGPDGNDVNLMPIFESIDTSAFKAVAEAIQAQNSAAFSEAYRGTLESCYACHKSSGMPYLRPMVPTEPGRSIINVDGAAVWPQ